MDKERVKQQEAQAPMFHHMELETIEFLQVLQEIDQQEGIQDQEQDQEPYQRCLVRIPVQIELLALVEVLDLKEAGVTNM